MADDFEALDPQARAQKRLSELLATLSRTGLTQQQVAAQAGLPSQYLSDIKHGRRPMTELVARRLGEGLDVSHAWLMGIDEAMRPPAAPAHLPSSANSVICLPLFPHPIEGEPRAPAMGRARHGDRRRRRGQARLGGPSVCLAVRA